MSPQSFINFWNGKIDDTDGVPKGRVYQCVDTAKRYLNQVYKLPMLAYGNAADYWEHTNPVILTKFNKVPPTTAQLGDIVVFRRLPENGNGGHIGIAANSASFLSQNYGTGNGKGTGLDRIRLAPIPYNKLIGILRPKGGEVAEPIFNDGDRLNINFWLYGQDLSLHGNQVGKTYKNAVAGVFTSSEYGAASRVNPGDVINMGGGDAAKVQGKVWKSAAYDFLIPAMKPQQYEEVTVYRKVA